MADTPEQDVAKALAERYAEKLAEQRVAHEAAIASMERAHALDVAAAVARAREEALQGTASLTATQGLEQPPPAHLVASALALAGKFAQLEASVEAFVCFCGERERMLNATVVDLARALRRRDRLL